MAAKPGSPSSRSPKASTPTSKSVSQTSPTTPRATRSMFQKWAYPLSNSPVNASREHAVDRPRTPRHTGEALHASIHLKPQIVVADPQRGEDRRVQIAE